MITITPTITLEDSDIEMQAIRAQGAGGQNVNKVSSSSHKGVVASILFQLQINGFIACFQVIFK